MAFQLTFHVAVLVYVMVDMCGSLTLNCVSSKPKDQQTLSCTCINPTKNGVEWSKGSSSTTFCDGAIDSCFPAISGYTSDVSKDEFYLQISPYSHTDCTTYTCKDTTTGDEEPITSSIADFDNSTITTAEPGANKGGPISITTDCVFSPSDLEIKWFKLQDGDVLDFADPVQSNDRSTCSRTCNSLEDQKVTSGFTHTEYNGSNAVDVQFMVTVSHSSYSEQFTWTSATYKIEGATSTTTSTTSTATPDSTTTSPASITTTPASLTTTPASTTTTTPSTTTTTTPTTTTRSTLRTTTTPITTISTTSLSDEMIIVIVIVPVGVIALVGTVIFFCLFYRLRMGKRKSASHERHKHRRHYKGNMIPVQQHQQQSYIMYNRGHTGEPTHKETKRSRSLHNDDRYNLYNGYHRASRVKQNAVYKGDRNLDRLYYNETLPRYDDYRSGYTTGHVYPSHTSGYQYRRDYHGDSRPHGNHQHSSYPVYSIQQEYINHSYSYMGY